MLLGYDTDVWAISWAMTNPKRSPVSSQSAAWLCGSHMPPILDAPSKPQLLSFPQISILQEVRVLMKICTALFRISQAICVWVRLDVCMSACGGFLRLFRF